MEEDGIFTVKSAYHILASKMNPADPWFDTEAFVFKKLWSSPAPSKIIAFSWQLLYDRLPSKRNLYRRGAGHLLENQNCVWCIDGQETGNHLFLHCRFAQAVWREICNWLCLDPLVPQNLFVLFHIFFGGAGNKKIRKGFLLIWHTTLWWLWKTRNGVIFKSVFKNPKEVAEEIIVTSWRWSVHRLNIAPCLFYEWSSQPVWCLGR
jgi:hypothetical protein